MIGTDAQRKRAPHAEAYHDDLVGSSSEALVRGLGGTGPIGPTGGQHVVDRGAVAGQQRHLDVVAGGGKRFRHTAHAARVAGEAVEHERAVRR